MIGKRLLLLGVCFLSMLLVGRVMADPTPTTPEPDYQTGEIIAHIPGEARAVTVQGNVAYVGFDNELKIIDITNKQQPVVLGQLTVSDIIWDIAVQERVAYLVNSAGIEMVDVSIFEKPQWLGVYAEESALQIHLDGQYVYLLTWFGLRVLDATNTLDLKQVSAMDIEKARDLDLLGKHAFILGENNYRFYFYIIDISDLTRLEVVKVIEDFRSDQMYMTKTHILAIGDICSSTCVTYLTVANLDWQIWGITGRGSHYSTHSSSTQAVAANKMYAFAGKDIGLWAYNYIEEGLNRGPVLIEKFDVGRVRQIEPTDDYIYTASTTEQYKHLRETKAGGFYILPAPPLFNSYLPLVAQ